MPAKKHRPEEMIGRLRETESCWRRGRRRLKRVAGSRSAKTYYRWRKEYGGLKTDQARRMEPKAAVRPTIWRRRMRGFVVRFRI